MFKDTELKKGIISGIISSSIFLIFLQPILRLIWNAIIVVSNKVYSGYIDKIYQKASLGKMEWIGFVVFFLLIYLLFILLYIYLKGARFKLKRLLQERSMDLMNEEERRIFIDKKRQSFSAGFEQIKKRFRILILLSYIVQILFVFESANLILTAYIDLQLNTSFSQRCTVISPYISDQEQKVLQSKWASMKNRKDYELVNNYLENLAKSKNIELPETLLK